MIAVPGTTYWGISQDTGVSVPAIEAANPWPATGIPVGANIIVPGAGNSNYTPPNQAPVQQAPQPPAQPQNYSSPSQTASVPQQAPQPAPQPQQAPVQQSDNQQASPDSSGYSIPGMSQSMANCIAYRESTDDQNPAANGDVFGIIPASGYNVAGDSVAQQEQVAGQIYAQSGGQAWAADGCPGT